MPHKNKLKLFLYLLLVFLAGFISVNFLYGLLFAALHEISHIICAFILGYHTDKIEMLPFGFTANLKEEFIMPFDDIIISFSGPFINLFFFAVFYFINLYFNKNFEALMKINLMLFIFNMLPADFLDGGRILKALLKLYAGFYIAWYISFINGVAAGILLLFLSIYTKSILNGIILVVIAVYMFFSCYKSKKEIMLNIVRDVLIKKTYSNSFKNFRVKIKTYDGSVYLADIIKSFAFKKYYIIYLVENHTSESVFSESDILDIYFKNGNLKLEECMKLSYKQEE